MYRVFVVLASVVVFLLISEYQYVWQQSDKLKRLKQEYRMHQKTFKKIWQDYLTLKKRVACLPETLKSLDSTVEQEGIFVPLNRSLEHLKQSGMQYVRQYDSTLQQHYLDSLQWSDYTDQALKVSLQDNLIESQEPALFVWPIEQNKFWLSSLFGLRKKPNGTKAFHYGIDMAACKGTKIKAAADGIVERVYFDAQGYGNTILIKHDDTYTTRYAHLDACVVAKGQQVKKGLCIGYVGDTGNVRKVGKDASHLHFEVYVLGKRINPLYVLS